MTPKGVIILSYARLGHLIRGIWWLGGWSSWCSTLCSACCSTWQTTRSIAWRTTLPLAWGATQQQQAWSITFCVIWPQAWRPNWHVAWCTTWPITRPTAAWPTAWGQAWHTTWHTVWCTTGPLAWLGAYLVFVVVQRSAPPRAQGGPYFCKLVDPPQDSNSANH